MKRILIGVLALMMLLTEAYATGGAYDASGCDTVQNEDGSVSMLGIPGEPVPITWGEFVPRFTKSLEENGFTGDFTFSTPVFTDGLWARHIIFDDILYVRAATTTDDDNGLVVALSAVAQKDDDTLSEYVKYLTACLFEAAARTEDTFGQTILKLFHIDPALDVRGYSLEKSYWYQNGFTMYIGVHNNLYATGRIEYTGAYEKAPVAPLKGNPFYETPIAEGVCDTDAFFARANPYFEMVFGGKAEKIFEQVTEGRRMLAYSVGDDTLYLTLLLNGEGESASIGNMMIIDSTQSPPNVFIGGQVALYALANMPEDALNACGFINGERSTWDELCELLPCAAYSGVQFCCVNLDNMGPTVILFGEE